jgi:CheY-like chemotaxis protein
MAPPPSKPADSAKPDAQTGAGAPPQPSVEEVLAKASQLLPDDEPSEESDDLLPDEEVAPAPPPPPPSIPIRKTLTTADIAQYCGVSTFEVLHWIRDGKLQARKIPGRGDYVVEAEDFVAYCKANQQPLPTVLLPTAQRALVIESDDKLARELDHHLQAAGFRTFVARDGYVGGASLESFRPHVAVVDLLMPGLTGYEVLNVLRDKSAHLGTKILALTDMPVKMHDEIRHAGAHIVLRKPFATKDVIEKACELSGDLFS